MPPNNDPSLLEPAIVAALVAAAVSLTTLWWNSRKSRLDRQRQLFADAFYPCIAYREFVYVIRRRRADDVSVERQRITGELSEIQKKLSYFKAILRVEAPRVSDRYDGLVAETKRIAGPQISKAWDDLPAGDDRDVHIEGVDFAELKPFEDAYLQAVADHFAHPLSWSRLRRSRTRKLAS